MKYRTIPEMFITLKEKYENKRDAFRYKVGNEYIGITHSEFHFFTL
jgi:hypothetical protein